MFSSAGSTLTQMGSRYSLGMNLGEFVSVGCTKRVVADTHWQAKKKMSHANIGRAGRKNCRVMGRTSEVRRSVARPVLIRGPGFWMTQSEKIPKKAKKRYCPSNIVHLCDCSARSVSIGLNEVWRAVIEEAGDCRFRIFDRSFRRIL